MTPCGPCFEAGPKGYFSFERKFTSLPKMKLLGVLSGFYERLEIFDSAGKVWRVQELQCREKNSRWLRFLAHLFYNPWVDVEYVWAEPRDYTLDDLKARYAAAVESDDDILTQFVEPESLKAKIQTASSFTDLVAVYRAAQKETR